MNKPYTPLVASSSKFIPHTSEELAIMARYAEKERLEQEALMKQVERDQARKRYWQKKQAEKWERERKKEERMKYNAKLKALMAEGKTWEQTLAILGPFRYSEEQKGFLNYGA